MAGRCLSAPELAIKCHIPRLSFPVVYKMSTYQNHRWQITNSSALVQHGMQEEDHPPFTEQDNTQNLKPGFICESNVLPQVLLYMHCWLYCFLCLLFGKTRVSCENCGWSELRRPDWPWLCSNSLASASCAQRLLERTIALGFVSLILHSIYGLATTVFQPTTPRRKGVIPRLTSPAHYCLVYSQAVPQLHTLNQEIPGER